MPTARGDAAAAVTPPRRAPGGRSPASGTRGRHPAGTGWGRGFPPRTGKVRSGPYLLPGARQRDASSSGCCSRVCGRRGRGESGRAASAARSAQGLRLSRGSGRWGCRGLQTPRPPFFLSFLPSLPPSFSPSFPHSLPPFLTPRAAARLPPPPSQRRSHWPRDAHVGLAQGSGRGRAVPLPTTERSGRGGHRTASLHSQCRPHPQGDGRGRPQGDGK